MPTSRVKRAFKYRFYPTPEQAAEPARTFGCVRKVYNMALTARTEAWYARSERMNYNAISALLTAWKKSEELAYLNEVSCVPLQQALRHLQTAFNNFFAKRARYPRYKAKKKSRASAEYTRSAFRFRDGKLTLAKMAEPLAIVWSRPLPDGAEPSTVTVSQDSAGRWFVSLLVEDPAVRSLAATDAAVGLDAGLDYLFTGEMIVVDRWFPSSKLCSACGTLQPEMPLGIRKWTCACGITHDRDVNAAKNLLAAGLAVSACGADVRPQRGLLPDGAVGAEAGSPAARAVGTSLVREGREVNRGILRTRGGRGRRYG